MGPEKTFERLSRKGLIFCLSLTKDKKSKQIVKSLSDFFRLLIDAYMSL